MTVPTSERAALVEFVKRQTVTDRRQLIFEARQHHWRQHPLDWVEQRLGDHLWSSQATILEAVRDHPRVTVRSCHAVGKSFTAAAAVSWWLDCHPPGTAFAVTTAPTGPQVRAILWREITRMHQRGGLMGRTNQTEWWTDTDELIGFGRKPSDTTPDAFQGLHAEHVLVVLDEASGIPQSIWDAASTLAANVGSRMLAIGNPDNPAGAFATSHKPNSGWHSIRIGWEDTPNATGEDIPDRLSRLLISKDWVTDRARVWGKDSALYVAKVDGEFPKDTTDGVIPASWVAKVRVTELAESTPWDAGLDVGAGGDRTVLRERRGPVCGRELTLKDADPMAQIGRIVATLVEWQTRRVKVDTIGVGWALAGRLKELSSKHNPSGERTHDAEVVAVNVAECASEPDRFINLRTELAWKARDACRLGSWDLTRVDDDLAAELAATRYDIVDSSGKVKLEPKDKVKARLGVSPDRADALLLAYHEPLSGASITNPAAYKQRMFTPTHR